TESGKFSATPPDRDANPTGYRLKGIVAHQGTADHGHCYSLIRVDGDRWLEFNDRRVTPYNPANIPRDCFGGAVVPEAGNPEVVGAGNLHETNAYLLLYECTPAPTSRQRGRALKPSMVPPSATSWRAAKPTETSPTSQEKRSITSGAASASAS
ncbi:unnamed protein product, partial [Laminaria digitata]